MAQGKLTVASDRQTCMTHSALLGASPPGGAPPQKAKGKTDILFDLFLNPKTPAKILNHTTLNPCTPVPLLVGKLGLDFRVGDPGGWVHQFLYRFGFGFGF